MRTLVRRARLPPVGYKTTHITTRLSVAVETLQLRMQHLSITAAKEGVLLCPITIAVTEYRAHELGRTHTHRCHAKIGCIVRGGRLQLGMSLVTEGAVDATDVTDAQTTSIVGLYATALKHLKDTINNRIH